MRTDRRWIATAGALLFAVTLLYPLTAFFARIGPWQWSGDIRDAGLASVRVSLLLTTCAMFIIVVVGTPVALYITRCGMRERLVWQAVLLIPILLPPLALGILLALAFGPYGAVGSSLQRFGIVMTNSATAFVSTQIYVGMGYYVLGAVAAFDSVPVILQKQAALLGLAPWKVFLRVTLPLARLGLAVALSITWIRTISEFGAVVVTAYYPSGIPVQLWVSLQSLGLPAVMPLLIVFLAVSLLLPWLIHVLAQRNAMLKARIIKRRREVHIDVSIELARGDSLGLFGTSGAGKSTVLACIAGIEEPDADFVHFGSAQFFPASMPLHKRGVGFLTQDPGLFPHLRVGENVNFGIPNELATNEEHSRWIGTLRDRLQLKPLWNVPASLISGGQARRVGLARMLARKPQLVLLDEPFTGLDRQLTRELIDDLVFWNQTLGFTMIAVDHVAEVLRRLCPGQATVIENGKVVQRGIWEDLYRDPATPLLRSLLAPL